MNDKKSKTPPIEDNLNKDSSMENEDSDKIAYGLTPQKTGEPCIPSKSNKQPGPISFIIETLIFCLMIYIVFFQDTHFVIKICCLIIALITAIPLYIALSATDNAKKKKEIERKKEIDSRLVCPFCLTKGSVETEFINQEIKISGIDGLTAIYTNDMSIFEKKLAEAEEETSIKAYCSKCESTWFY